MKIIRLYTTVLLVALCTEFYSCSSFIDQQMDFAEAKFIAEVSYMTEKEALSKEIEYYKTPDITVRQHVRSLTGKDLIHECNNIISKNEEALEDLRNGRRTVIKTRNVYDIKEYALEHPDDIIANEFEFSGTFTHYGPDKYSKKSAFIIVVPQLEKYIINRTYDKSPININSPSYLEKSGESYDHTSYDDYIVKQLTESILYRYNNTRFNYGISYPSCFYQEEESANGDGCKISMNKDIYLVVSAINNVLEQSLESQYYEYDISSATYSILKNNWFIISGFTSDGRIFYRKTVLLHDTFITATLYYTSQYKISLDPFIKRIFTKFPS